MPLVVVSPSLILKTVCLKREEKKSFPFDSPWVLFRSDISSTRTKVSIESEKEKKIESLEMMMSRFSCLP